MALTLLIKEEALQDLEEAFQSYEGKQHGLGKELLDEVELYFGRIAENPAHYQKHIDKRVAVLHRFPYKIVYEVEKDFIIVYAVFHTKRGPQELRQRI